MLGWTLRRARSAQFYRDRCWSKVEEPDRAYSKRGDMLQFLQNPGQVSNPISGGAPEGARIDWVNDSTTPPGGHLRLSQRFSNPQRKIARFSVLSKRLESIFC